MKIPDNGYYNSPPLRSDLVLKVGIWEQIRVMLTNLSLGLPSPLKAYPMLPLNFDHVHQLIPQGLHILIQDFRRPIDVIQSTIDLNVL